MTNDKSKLIHNAIDNMLKMFKSGNFPQAVALSIIRKQKNDNVPSDKWSIGNKLLMMGQGTHDARGFKQWQQVNRQVKKGSKAIYILSPRMKKITDDETGEQKPVIVGFSSLPVFRYEDTEGEELPTFDYTPKTYPPFFEVAEKLGIEVVYKPFQSIYLGSFNSTSNKITLCSEDTITYYHELAHAVDNCLNPTFNTFSKERKEIVAEFAGIVLCQLSNIKGYEDQSYEYIKRYCKKDKTDAAILKSIMNVLTDVEKVVDKILSVA